MLRRTLTLGDGTRWSFEAEGAAAGVLRELSEIMRLRADGDFADVPMALRLIDEAVSGEPWMVENLRYNTPSVRIAVNNRGSSVTEIGAASLDDTSRKGWIMPHLLFPIYDHAVQGGGLPVHAALLEHSGKGAVVAASGGTGKSTCSSRVPPPWSSPADDEVLLVRDRRGHIVLHPFPTWTDYGPARRSRTFDVQRSFPLHGLFFLEQAAFDEAVPMGAGEAAIRLYGSATEASSRYLPGLTADRRKAFLARLFQNACAVSRQTPAFRLKATLTGSFWEAMAPLVG